MNKIADGAHSVSSFTDKFMQVYPLVNNCTERLPESFESWPVEDGIFCKIC